MPNFVTGIAAAGVDELRGIVDRFADWQLTAPIDTTLTTAEELAGDYLAKLEYPQHIFGKFSSEAQDRIAVAVGCPMRADWQQPPAELGTPDYLLPTWERDVHEIVFTVLPPQPPQPRPLQPRTVTAAQWPELAQAAPADAGQRDQLTKELVAALGTSWSAVPDQGDGVLRLHCDRVDLTFVVVPGGLMRMGASDEELAEFESLDEELEDAVEFLAAQSRPVREVIVAPFLCAQTPLLERHMSVLSIDGDPGNTQRVLRQDSWDAAATVSKSGLRLLSEAEAEWIARDGGRQSWLFGHDDPEEWAERMVEAEPGEARTPFGTFMMGWGEWVDDGWHDDYTGAPSDSHAWEPTDRPITVRAAALASWPWQGGGEAVLLHAACRDRDSGQSSHAVRLAADLPARQ
jgi:hypothetical protein